mgnify:CR=1 FL=1
MNAKRTIQASFGIRSLFVVVSAALLVVTLFRPELVRQTARKDQPLVAVLCDASGSMATRDVRMSGGGDLSREGWVQTQCVARFWAPIARPALRATTR